MLVRTAIVIYVLIIIFTRFPYRVPYLNTHNTLNRLPKMLSNKSGPSVLTGVRYYHYPLFRALPAAWLIFTSVRYYSTTYYSDAGWPFTSLSQQLVGSPVVFLWSEVQSIRGVRSSRYHQSKALVEAHLFR